MDEKEIVGILREILNFRNEIREKGNSDYDRISNKDILLHLLVKFEKIEQRVTFLEAKVKMCLWFIPVIIAMIGVLKIF
ncbi:MAG: hypothetical protein R6U65_10620 [Perlabentimonas sp.]